MESVPSALVPPAAHTAGIEGILARTAETQHAPSTAPGFKGCNKEEEAGPGPGRGQQGRAALARSQPPATPTRVVAQGFPGSHVRPWHGSWRLSWKRRCEFFVAPLTAPNQSLPSSAPEPRWGQKPPPTVVPSLGMRPTPECTMRPFVRHELRCPRETRARC